MIGGEGAGEQVDLDAVSRPGHCVGLTRQLCPHVISRTGQSGAEPRVLANQRGSTKAVGQ